MTMLEGICACCFVAAAFYYYCRTLLTIIDDKVGIKEVLAYGFSSLFFLALCALYILIKGVL